MNNGRYTSKPEDKFTFGRIRARGIGLEGLKHERLDRLTMDVLFGLDRTKEN